MRSRTKVDKFSVLRQDRIPRAHRKWKTWVHSSWTIKIYCLTKVKNVCAWTGHIARKIVETTSCPWPAAVSSKVIACRHHMEECWNIMLARTRSSMSISSEVGGHWLSSLWHSGRRTHSKRKFGTHNYIFNVVSVRILGLWSGWSIFLSWPFFRPRRWELYSCDSNTILTPLLIV